MARKSLQSAPTTRRVFTKEFRQEAVQMLLDGHAVSSVVERLGLSIATLLYRWKQDQLRRSGPVAGEELEVQRRWKEAGAKGKVFVNGEPSVLKDFLHNLLARLSATEGRTAN